MNGARPRSVLPRRRRRPSELARLWIAAGMALAGCNRGQEAAPQVNAEASVSSVAARPSAPPNALPVPSASVAAAVNPEKLPVYDGPLGSIEGTVFVRGPEAPEVGAIDATNCPAALDTYGKLFRAGPARPDGLRPLADAVVVIAGYAGFYLPERSEAVKVVITPNCAYPARTIALTFGQRLEIANASRLAFAPTLSGTFRPAIMIAPPGEAGDPVKIYPPRPGHFMLGDTLQPFVREVVLVLRQPLHAVTDLAGHYRIDDVPAGHLKAEAILEAVGADQQKDVAVREQVVEQVDFTLTYREGPATGMGADAGHEHIIP